MKAHSLKLTMFLIILFIYQVNSLSYTYHEIIHEDSEYAKVCTLDDHNVLVLSSVRGEQKSKESKFDKKGNVVYGNMTLNFGYPGSSQLVQPHAVAGKPVPDYLMSYHNKQTLSGKSPNETITEFKQGVISRSTTTKINCCLKKWKSIISWNIHS